MRSDMRLLVPHAPDSLSLLMLHTAFPQRESLRLVRCAASAWMALVISSRLSVARSCCIVNVLLWLMLRCLCALNAVRLGAALDSAAL